MSNFIVKLVSLYCLILNTIGLCGQIEKHPFSIKENLFDTMQANTLGLQFAPGCKSFTIFRPKLKDYHYNHGVVLFPFKGFLYAQWQSSQKDEDAPETRIMYSRSKNGKHWSKPKVLTEASENHLTTNGGWWANGDTLIAYISLWSDVKDGPKQGITQYITSIDGKNWSEAKPVMTKRNGSLIGIIEQDLHALPNGRIITAFHEQPGLIVKPWFTDDKSGVSGWIRGNMENLPYKKFMSRELEPGWFYRSDSAVVMIFRDQAGSYKKLASVSYDKGVTWSLPVVTNMPDSRAKQSAGNLPNGTAFQVNNPSGNKNRYPLVIVLSKDGFLFNKAYLIRSGDEDLQKKRYEGHYKREGYSYPKSVVWKKYLYISYATNKEDIEISRIPLKGINR